MSIIYSLRDYVVVGGLCGHTSGIRSLFDPFASAPKQPECDENFRSYSLELQYGVCPKSYWVLWEF